MTLWSEAFDFSCDFHRQFICKISTASFFIAETFWELIETFFATIWL